MTKLKESHEGAAGGLLVPELMARVKQIQLRTHKLVNTALAGGYRSTFHGTGLEFQEVRHYQPGDDVRSIDWNVTARTGVPHIKKYAEERELSVHLIVDISRSMDFGSARWTKREAAAQFSALLSFVAMRNQDRVGLTLFGDRPGLHLDAKKGNRHVLRVVREVIAARPTPGGSDLFSVLDESLRGIKGRGMVFLLSDFLGAPADEDDPGARDGFWGEPLKGLALRHDMICVRVFDPLEEELPRAGLVQFEDIEGGQPLELDTRSAAVRAAWARDARERNERLRATFFRSRVDSLEISSAGNLAEPLEAFFRGRIRRHGGRSA
ncbi:MAG: DUF58 domain-containing protein [bacterium]|nr:DUF58 domain-containing protein [Planctomycetota bacterium]HIL52837.1 DUF58 domain-containing protein [Planctomycetota bacterium]